MLVAEVSSLDVIVRSFIVNNILLNDCYQVFYLFNHTQN